MLRPVAAGGYAVKLRLFPREEAYFDLFEAAATNAVDSARVLREMVEDFTDPKAKAAELVDLEHKGDRVIQEVVTRLNKSFVTPFDREDIYTLANQLDDVVDAIEAVGDMLVLHQVDAPIEPVVAQSRLIEQAAQAAAEGVRALRDLDREVLDRCFRTVNDLEDEGDRLYRRARADLYSFSDDLEHPTRYLVLWKDIIEQLEETMDGLEDVADTIEQIVLKYA
jgi:predicted phosphate transport protein (TIGR00153 family)